MNNQNKSASYVNETGQHIKEILEVMFDGIEYGHFKHQLNGHEETSDSDKVFLTYEAGRSFRKPISKKVLNILREKIFSVI